MSSPIRPDVSLFSFNRGSAFESPGYLPQTSAWQSRLVPQAQLSLPFETLSMLTAKAKKACDTSSIRVRWALSAMPLTLFIENSSSEIALQIMEVACQWESASMSPDGTQPLIRFQRLFQFGESQTPDITIRFEKNTVLGRDYETGHTERKVDAKGFIQHVDIVLIESPALYAQLSPEMQSLCFSATVLHELGHALGLEHSQHKTDVMYYRGWQNAHLSQADIVALRALYARPDTLLG